MIEGGIPSRKIPVGNAGIVERLDSHCFREGKQVFPPYLIVVTFDIVRNMS